MNVPFYIAGRYLVSKSKQNAINIINGISVFVVVVAAAALFVVLAGFAGLEKYSLTFASVFDPDLKITPKTGKTITITDAKMNDLRNISGIASYAKVIEERVFLNFKNKNHIAYIKGVDANYGNVNAIDSILGYGGWVLSDNTVVIGNGISNTLGMGIYDRKNRLQIIVPKPGKGSVASTSKPFNDAFVIATGIYQVTEELDKKYVFTPIDMAQHLASIPNNEVSFIEVKLAKDANQKAVIKKIEHLYDGRVVVKNREQLNDALYKMLNTENVAIYLIFTLVLIVALFNLAGAITMMILDKKENLKTLYAMGVTLKKLRLIFFLMGGLITVLGGLTGLIIGYVLLWVQQVYPFVFISPTLAYPVVPKVTDMAIVMVTITILGFGASKIAANRVSRRLLT
ncbi:membrane protein [Neptunitalea chrysea]|uniref:Membrane protein n=1 Tax=Neptunitalea chrysea TaxID=1647581 RepID=A0A9W6B6J0_9FLAO|nr:FtsX-like permease family protein [Neptunitalea chrysea]GLB53441.1 membrane protein [Neptunitalea chrysea]